jgi:hypothetical protein
MCLLVWYVYTYVHLGRTINCMTLARNADKRSAKRKRNLDLCFLTSDAPNFHICTATNWCKVDPVHTIRHTKTIYMNLSTRWRWVVKFAPTTALFPRGGGGGAVSIEQEAVRARETVWAFRRRKKSLAVVRIRILERPVQNPISDCGGAAYIGPSFTMNWCGE